MKKKVLITFKHTPFVLEKFSETFDVIGAPEKHMAAPEILKLAKDNQVEGLMVSTGQVFDEKMMNALPNSVKVIATSSVGFDHLDRKTAKTRGIVLTNTPDVLSDCTADLSFMLLLNVFRRAHEYTKLMDKGWNQLLGSSEMLGLNLKNKNLGIIGMGSIGQEVAVRARAFGMNIFYHNRKELSPDKAQGARYFKDLKEMLPLCDAVSLHAPATSETKHIMNTKTFSLMKRGSIIVNVARGSLIDERALIDNLRSGRLFGAGLDVFENEPHFNRELLNFSNVFLTPHIGSATVETRNAMGLLALENIKAVLEEKEAITPIDT